MILAQSPATQAPTPPPAGGQPAGNPFEQLPLRDIHLPAEPSLWPLAPGWWVLIAMGVLVLAYLAWRLIRRLKRRAFIRRVKALLDEDMAAVEDGARVAAAVSMLLRRAALSRYPKREVASLTGPSWLAFLDRTGGDGAFSRGAGQVLADGPWRPRTEVDRGQLKAVAHRWLEANL